MPGFQNGNYVCHRSAKGQEIQTGNTGKGSENELDPVINPFPASAYVPGSHRKGKCIKGNRRDIYNNGRCADEQKGAWDLHQFPIAAGRNTAFFYGKAGGCKKDDQGHKDRTADDAEAQRGQREEDLLSGICISQFGCIA